MNNTAKINQDHIYGCVCFGCDKERGRTLYTPSEWMNARRKYAETYCEHCGQKPALHAGNWNTLYEYATKDCENQGIFAGGSCRIEDLKNNNHLRPKGGFLKSFENFYHAFSSEYVFIVSSVFLPKGTKSL